MQMLHVVLWTLGIEAGIWLLCFMFFPNFCRKFLGRQLAVSFMFRDAGKNYSGHMERILGAEQKKVQPISGPAIIMKPTDRPAPIEELVINALVKQGATKKQAITSVYSFRGEGMMGFEDLFRKATSDLRSKKKVMGD